MKYGACAAAAALALLLAARPADENLDTITLHGMPCGLEGAASPADPGGEKELNRHKNRWSFPADADIDPSASLAAMLAPGQDQTRFDQEKAARARGYVLDVKPGGVESCNCHATNPDEKDTHIELALAPGAPTKQCVIVEVTPRLRMLMKKKDVDWTTAALRKKYKGKWVEVTGWLLFDSAHIKEAENTNPGHRGNWRATCWEVHPVTDIQPLPAAPDEAADFKPASLSSLQKLHAAHVARTPNGKASLDKLHAKSLSRFSKKYLEEVEEEAKERRPKD